MSLSIVGAQPECISLVSEAIAAGRGVARVADAGGSNPGAARIPSQIAVSRRAM